MTWFRNVTGFASMTEDPRYISVPSDSERRARRKELRRLDAAAQIAEQRWRELNEAIDVCLATKEALAAQHVKDCEPIQRELKAIEDKQIDAAVKTQTRDAQLEDRRRQLEAEIRDRNLALEANIAAESKMIDSLSEKRRTAGLASNRNQIMQELLHTASLALATGVRVSESRLASARARFDATALGYAEKDPFRLALAADAEKELARAQQLADEAYRAAIDEP